MSWRSIGAIPLPPKKTVAEHIQTQAAFLQNQLEPVLAAAKAGKAHVFFGDAAHFVMGSFLCCVWCWVRMMIRGASGRQRYSVLGAWNAITNTLVSVTTDTVVNAETMAELLRKIARLGLQGPVHLVLDNARYQHCAVIEALAAQLNIQLMFLPSYSPHLNLIEGLWRFVKKKALYGRHDATFADFRGAIDDCLSKIDTDHRDALKTLMTHKFQTFEKVSILAA